MRFLNTIGYEEYAAECLRLQISLLMLVSMPMVDLERKLGVTPKKTVVALFDECLKLRRCLHRSSAAVEVPQWLPVVLKIPPDALSVPKETAARPSSARASAYVGPPEIDDERRTARPQTASERLRAES